MSAPGRATSGPSGRPPNVLITTAGRRTSLVQAFIDAARPRGGRVVTSDVDGLAPALYVSDDAVRTGRSDDPLYVHELLTIVEQQGIRLLVPTIDPDLPVLSQGASAFRELGCEVALSGASFVDVTSDKYATAAAFSAAGISTPATWLPPGLTGAALPDWLIVKPRRGSASQHVHAIDSADLPRILPLVPDPIVQELLTGPEITIDALLDLSGRPIHYVPRRRIRTLAGESIEGVTLEHDPAFETWIESVLAECGSLGATGPLTLQAFLTPGGPTLTEINPRFGGGFPLGHAAGALYPSWLLDMIDGRIVPPRLREYEAGLYMSRYAVEHFIRRPKW